ncbi:MAG: hypothetical protein J0L92_24860 [Deltaproteobacteria bacterium]|nr:hypothetical protein [Deltaproteobacteria bacterium]
MRSRNGVVWRCGVAGVLAGLCVACSSAHPQPDVSLDARPTCSGFRSATLAIINNFDSGGERNFVHTGITVELVGRLLRGDPDGDGVPEETPLERVRVLTTPNEPVRARDGDVLDCTVVSYGGAWSSTLIDARCPGSPHAGHPIFDIEPGDDFQADLDCFLYASPSRDGQCPALTFDTALAALSPRDSPVDLTPLVGLGDSTNAAYRERDDVLVVVLQSGNLQDECSQRTYEDPPDGVCSDPGEHPYCCEENLAPVTRTSDALRAILRGRPVVYAGYVQFAPFDPSTQPVAALDEMLSTHPPHECSFAGTLHTRTARLARELYPDMQLVPVACRGDETTGVPDVTALARHVFASICE